MPPPKAPSPEAEEDVDAQRAFEKLRKAAHVRPWDHGKDGLQKPCTVMFRVEHLCYQGRPCRVSICGAQGITLLAKFLN